jgi:hypothetical protein
MEAQTTETTGHIAPIMKTPARLHVYNAQGPRDTAYIVADRSGLRQLAEALKNAANSAVGMETLKLFAADGHAYEVMITCDIAEEEWQATELPYAVKSYVPSVRSINDYLAVKKELNDDRTIVS